VLRACNRVLKPGAPLAVFAVATSQGLTDMEKSRAIDAGPPHVATESSYPELLETSGFVDCEMVDLTDEYAATLSESIEIRDAEKAALVQVIGLSDFTEGQQLRRAELEAVADGLLLRYLVTARKP